MPQGFSPLRVERSDPTLGESVKSQGERRHPQIPFGASHFCRLRTIWFVFGNRLLPADRLIDLQPSE